MADRYTMTPEQRKEFDRASAQMRIDIQSAALRCEHWQSCLNCDHFSEGVAKNRQTPKPGVQPMFCTLFGAVPPAHVIVNGCPDWVMDIPF